jgi:magnesium-transporting ATPase (P-type)
MNDRALTRRWNRILWLTLGFGLVASLVGFLRYRLRQARRQQYSLPANLELDLQQFQGLTEAEAIARHSPIRAQKREQESQKVRRDIWRSRLFSIFNLSLICLAAVRALFGDPVGAWLTFGILILNIGINVAQQTVATRQLEKLMKRARPLATVIRNGRARTVEADDIVIGDLLVIGPGDEFLASGELLNGRPKVVGEMTLSGNRAAAYRGKGDLIPAGSYCIEGRAAYRVTAVPDDLGTKRWTPVQKKAELTPLQRIITRILRLLLVIVGVFLVLLLIEWINRPLLSQVFESKYRAAASIIFSISASGLFFMIVASYAIGSARLGGIGALIRESKAVESLAQVSVLCISKAGALTSAQVHLNMFPSVKGIPSLVENRTRHIIGDLAHSAPIDNFYFQALADNFIGNKRPLEQAVWFLSAFGWSAVTFSEADVEGTYVIGDPTILQPRLLSLQVAKEEEISAEDESSTLVETSSARIDLRLRREIRHLGRFFRRNDEKKHEGSDDAAAVVGLAVGDEADRSEPNRQESSQPVSGPITVPNGDAPEAQAAGRGSIFQGLRLRLDKIRRPAENLETEEAQDLEPGLSLPRLLFTYTPEPIALYDVNGRPQLPFNLIPLCTLTFEEQIQPQSVEVVRTFTKSGVNVKILTSEDPERMLGAAEQLGLTANEPAHQAAVSGLELAQMNKSQFDRVIKGATVLGHLTPEQKGDVVRSLRRFEEQVAMVGDRADDVPAMEAANLSITLRSSSQAALSTADIVLLEDSLQVLPAVLQQGQRIVNGLLDILKISLTQIGYILLLIVLMAITNRRFFYYDAAQGGIIGLITVTGPSMGLVLWSSARALPLQYMRSRLMHFIIPAVLTMTMATLAINQFFGPANINTPYSQLAVTYGLILMGLLLVVFVQPPTRFWVGGDVLSRDRRIIFMVILWFLVFIATTYIPTTQGWFHLAPLTDVRDYAVIVVVSIAWTLLIRAFWRSPWLRRRAGIMSDSSDRNAGLSQR